MGGRASRELSETQQTVKRLSAELQKVLRDLEVNKAGATKAVELQSQVSTLSASLQNAKKELEFNVGRLRLAEAEKTKVQGLRIQLDNVQTELQKKEDVAAKAERERRELEEANLKLLEEAGKLLQNHKSEHPTLGMLVADMGHKLIYRANPITLLAQTQVWRKQRAFRPARAEKIGLAKLKSPIEGWPGTITAAGVSEGIDHQEGSMVIIDGQHRLGACSFLESKGKLLDHLKEVTVEVYPAMKEAQIQDLFTEINKCEPVLDVDLPDIGAGEMEQAILEGAMNSLREKYIKMFSVSSNCKRPHVNVDKLRNALHQADILNKFNLKTQQQLISWLETENEKMGKRSDDDLKENEGATVNMIHKCRSEGFFLGIGSKWLPNSE